MSSRNGARSRHSWRKVERELQGQGYPVVRGPFTFGFGAVHGIWVHDDGSTVTRCKGASFFSYSP